MQELSLEVNLHPCLLLAVDYVLSMCLPQSRMVLVCTVNIVLVALCTMQDTPVGAIDMQALPAGAVQVQQPPSMLVNLHPHAIAPYVVLLDMHMLPTTMY